MDIEIDLFSSGLPVCYMIQKPLISNFSIDKNPLLGTFTEFIHWAGQTNGLYGDYKFSTIIAPYSLNLAATQPMPVGHLHTDIIIYKTTGDLKIKPHDIPIIKDLLQQSEAVNDIKPFIVKDVAYAYFLYPHEYVPFNFADYSDTSDDYDYDI